MRRSSRNYLRVTMINVHNELTKRIDVAAVRGYRCAPSPSLCGIGAAAPR